MPVVVRDPEVEPHLLALRFWKKVWMPRSGAECFIWTGAKEEIRRGKKGYGYIRLKGRRIYAHRLAWALANWGWPPLGLLVLHACHNRLCVNATHLRAGTHGENMREMVHYGRQGRGPTSGPLSEGIKMQAQEGEVESKGQLVVIARVKEAIQKHGLKMSGDLMDGLSTKVEQLVTEAAARCKANGRATMRPYDL